MALLGCIADDFTGATDLASMLVKHGMRAVQLIGVPRKEDPIPETDAIVIALKSRTAPVAEAVSQSLAALDWLREAGCRQFFFKYCSTFDSTDAGNIGPVADALLEALGENFAFVCPAFPANGRTVYQGHLFVGSALLNESGMENHPLTPMRDANLVRVLGRQTAASVALIPYAVVEAGPEAIRQSVQSLREKGLRYGVVDALNERHLFTIGEAAADHRLVTGGSGIAMGLPENFRRKGELPPRADAALLPRVAGRAAVIAGSCSRATLTQLEIARARAPTFMLDLLQDPSPANWVSASLAWARAQHGDAPIVIAASAAPERVAALQAKLGREAAGAMIEAMLAEIAEGVVAQGVRRLVVAGGETSGAVVARLGVRSLRIGPEIDPGVPWTYAEGSGPAMLLALKSGNFGAPDFFLKAFMQISE
jgi:uncharacterized protein YgbK (DUF1537 family)